MSRPLSLALALSALFLTAHSASNGTKALTAAGTDSSSSSDSDRVYLRSITALIFSETGRASSRYGPGRQELRCVGGSASGFGWFSDYYPHQVQCRNIGWDGASIQWSCEGHLQDVVEFGPDTEVKCEPYDEDADDGYVLRGSCRLEYTLNFTTFHITSIHIIYGCVMAMILLWCYYQTRFWVHRYLKRRNTKKTAAALRARQAATSAYL